jgi:hypothetical protein
MGTTVFDIWSIGHFLMGILSQSLLQKAGIMTPVNFILTNAIHLAIELFEKDVKHGELSESYENHITDIIAFFLGWCLSYIINTSQYIPLYSVQILWGILLLVLVKEILVEIYIDKKQEINNAFSIIMIFMGLLIIVKFYVI